MADLFALAAPRRNRVARRAYLAAINGAPRIWSGFYLWFDRHQVFPRHLWLLRRELRALEALLRQERPAAVCSTYPVYGFLLERLARTGRLTAPFHNLVTDSISINSLWTRPACHGWFVPNEETAGVMRTMGVPAARLHVLGFPVPAFFAEHAGDLAPPDLADRRGPARALIIHSGVRHAWATARRLLAETDWELTLAVGRDERLRRRLGGARGRPAAPGPHPRLDHRGSPPADDPPRRAQQGRRRHHAGGHRRATARCSSTRSCRARRRAITSCSAAVHAGALVETPEAVVAALRRAFADRGAEWRQWRAALAPLARPDASRAIAAHLLAGGAQPPVAVTA